jgi:hypothetical protein
MEALYENQAGAVCLNFTLYNEYLGSMGAEPDKEYQIPEDHSIIFWRLHHEVQPLSRLSFSSSESLYCHGE